MYSPSGYFDVIIVSLLYCRNSIMNMEQWQVFTQLVLFKDTDLSNHTRSPAVARMADRTAPVVQLTLTLTQILPGARESDDVSAHATAAKQAKTGTSPLTTSQPWKISSLKIS